MGLIDSGSKSSRLLASRRYTHNTLTTAQEAFTNVLDLRSEEIYTRGHLIPTSSLPHSGSSQKNLTYTTQGQSVTKYWYRQKLTKSNVNNEVWFFLNPTGSDDGVGAQLINDNQVTNLVSPKYAIASLATSTTEDATPGYLAAVFKSSAVSSSFQTSSLSSDDIVSTNDYQFDYKTGIVQFINSDKDPTNSDYIYMTVYQYVGDTLKTGLEVQGAVTASNLLVTGNSKVEGDLTLGGDITIGDDASDALTITADLTSHLIPDTSDTYNLGSDNQRWNDLYLSGSLSASGGPVDIDSATTVAIDSTTTTAINATTTLTAKGATGATFGDDTGTWEFDGAGALSETGITTFSLTPSSTVDVDAVGAITIDGVSLTVGGDGDTNIIKLTGPVTASTHVSASGNLSATGNLDIDGTANIEGNTTLQADLSVVDINASGDITGSVISGSSGVFTTINVDGGTVDSITSLTAGGNLDIGGYDLRAATITADGLTSGRVVFAGTAGVLSDDSDLSFSGDTLTATRVTSTHITASGDISASGDLTATGNLDIDGTTNLQGNVTVQNDLDITGTLTATEVHTTFISASIAKASGSNIFGDDTVDSHQFTGSLLVSGSASVEGSTTIDGVLTANSAVIDNITIDGTELDLSSGDFTLDVAGDIELNADGGDVTIKDDSAVLLNISSTKISGSVTSTGSFGALTVADGVTSTLSPISSDGVALGTTALQWSDLFLAEGGVINWDNGDFTATQVNNLLTLTGGNTRVDRLEIDSANDYVDVDTDLKIVAAADITLDPGGNNVKPGGDSADDLGVSGTAWRTLYVDSIKMNGQGSIDGATYITGSSVSASSGDFTTINVDGGTVDGITSLTAGGNLDIGGYDLRAATITPDGLTSGRVVFAGTDGVLSDDSDLTFSGATLTATNITSTTIKDFTTVSGSSVSTGSFGRVSTSTLDLSSIQGNWTNAGNTIADLGSVTTVDINAGTVDAITSLTVANDVDIGNYKITSKALEASDLTAGRVTFAGTNGLLADDSDLTFSTATLSATNITTTGTIKDFSVVSGSVTSTGSFGAITIGEIIGNWTNAGNTVADLGTITTTDINGGTVDGATIGASSHTTIKGTTIDATTDFTIDGLVITADTITNDAGLSIVASSGDITLDPGGNNVLPGGDSADDLGVSGTAWRALYVDSIEMNDQGAIAGVTHITASGAISASGDILSNGRIYEQGTSVVDHATAMAIVFGG